MCSNTQSCPTFCNPMNCIAHQALSVGFSKQEYCRGLSLPANSGDMGPSLSWRRKWQPTPVFLPEKSHGQKSLVGYSPWGSQKSQTRLSE